MKTAPTPRPRAALITSNFWPERTGIGQVTTELAQYLSENGIEVRVATAMPYYPEWRIYPEYRGLLGMSEKLGDITVYRAWHHSRPAPGSVGRLAHEASLCSFSIPQIVRALRHADVTYIVSPDLSLAFTASVIARAMRVRRVVMVQDVMPDAAVELGMLRGGSTIRLAQWMARTIYDTADEIVTLGEGMRERIQRYTTHGEKISLLPNTVDGAELAPRPGLGRSFRDRFVAEGTFAVVHAGNMGRKQDLDLLLRTAELLREETDVHFYVFGDGAVKEEFLRRRDAARLDNVSCFPFQPREMLPHMLYGADALLVSQLPEVIDTVVPSKLVTAMGAGAMIVAACAPNSETARLVRRSAGGLVVPASDAGALAEVILALRNGEIDASVYRDAARAYCLAHFERSATYGPHAANIHARWRAARVSHA
jgi:colanic acid biosynthesis glycosyl transferase WcaI